MQVLVRVGKNDQKRITHTYWKAQAYVLCYSLSAVLSQEGEDTGKRRNASIVSRQAPIPVQLTESCVRRMHPADVRQAVKWKRCLKCWSVCQPVQQWLCLFAILLSTTLQANFPAQTCWQNKRRKELMLGFWESLVGTRGLAHCVAVTLTFGNGERETKKSSLLISKLFATGHSPFRQQPLSPPTTWIFITPLLCPRVVFFSPHPETCRDVFDWPWHLKRSLNKGEKSCLWQLENTTWSIEGKNGILKEAELLHI